MEELYVAGWLHDFGKVSTPEFIMNKATKLEGLYDKIDFVKLKLEILMRDKIISFYRKKDKENQIVDLDVLEKIKEDIIFLEKCNVGGENMEDSLKVNIK